MRLQAGLTQARVNATGSVTQTATRPLNQIEAELIPLVKQGDAQVAAGDLLGGLTSYSHAMEGFTTAGHVRPKLQAKIDAVKARLGQQDARSEVEMES